MNDVAIILKLSLKRTKEDIRFRINTAYKLQEQLFMQEQLFTLTQSLRFKK